MADDPLAAFRKRETLRRPETGVPASSPDGREAYVAFATKDKLRCLDIRTAKDGLAHAPGYAYLTNISYNRKTYGEILLTMSRLMVVIKGRNLRSIVEALQLHACQFIQEFDPQEFDEPSDKDAPFVESINVKLFGAGSEPGK